MLIGQDIQRRTGSLVMGLTRRIASPSASAFALKIKRLSYGSQQLPTLLGAFDMTWGLLLAFFDPFSTTPFIAKIILLEVSMFSCTFNFFKFIFN